MNRSKHSRGHMNNLEIFKHSTSYNDMRRNENGRLVSKLNKMHLSLNTYFYPTVKNGTQVEMVQYIYLNILSLRISKQSIFN